VQDAPADAFYWRVEKDRCASGLKLNSVMEFSSGRPYAGLFSPCTSPNLSFSNCAVTGNDNLNDTAFSEDTANTAAGINGAGPTPGIGLNSFYGPWPERIDVALARSFPITEAKELQLQAQVFNLFNHANFYVQPAAIQTNWNQLRRRGNVESDLLSGAQLGVGQFRKPAGNQLQRPSAGVSVFDDLDSRVLRIPSRKRLLAADERKLGFVLSVFIGVYSWPTMVRRFLRSVNRIAAPPSGRSARRGEPEDNRRIVRPRPAPAP
jgi:hypothetical protein